MESINSKPSPSLRIHYYHRKSFSFHNNPIKDATVQSDFFNKFSSNFVNHNNKTFERDVNAISRIEKKRIFGEPKEEKIENYHINSNKSAFMDYKEESFHKKNGSFDQLQGFLLILS